MAEESLAKVDLYGSLIFHGGRWNTLESSLKLKE